MKKKKAKDNRFLKKAVLCLAVGGACLLYSNVSLAQKASDSKIKEELLVTIVEGLRASLEAKEEMINQATDEKLKMIEELSDLQKDNQKLLESLGVLSDTIKGLQDTIARQSKSVNSESNELKTLRKELRAAQKNLKIKDRKIQQVNMKHAVIAQELMSLKNHADTPRKVVGIKRQVQKDPERLKNTEKLLKTKQKNKFLSEEVQRLSQKNKQLEGDYLAIKNEFVERENMVPSAVNDVSRLYDKKIKKLEGNLARLEDALKSKESTISLLTEKYEKAIGHLTESEGQEASLTQELAQLKGELQAQQAAIEEAKQEKGRNEKLTALTKKQKKDISGLEIKLKDKKLNDTKEQQEALANRDSVILELKDTITALEETVQSKEARLIEVDSDLKKEMSDVSHFEELTKKITNDFNQVKAEAESLKNQLKKISKEKSVLEKRIVKIQTKQEERSAEFDQTKEILESKNQMIDKYSETINKLSAQTTALNEQLDTKKDENQSLSEELARTYETLKSQEQLSQKELSVVKETLKEQLEEARQTASSKEDKRKEYLAQIKQLEQEKDAIKFELESTTNSKIALNQEIEALKKQLVKAENSREESAQKVKGELDAKTAEFTEKINQKDTLLAKQAQKATELQSRIDELTEEKLKLTQEVIVLDDKLVEVDQLSISQVDDVKAPLVAQIDTLQKSVEFLKEENREKRASLKKLFHENELLLEELIKSKDDRIALHKDLLQVSKRLEDAQKQKPVAAADTNTQDIERKLRAITEKLIETENSIYEKELIIGDLLTQQKSFSRALDVAEENNQILKEKLKNTNVEQFSFNDKTDQLNLNLEQIERRLQLKINPKGTP